MKNSSLIMRIRKQKQTHMFMFFFSRLFYHLPVFILNAIIFNTVYSLSFSSGYYAGSVDEVHFKEQKLEEDSFLSDHGIQHMSMVEVKISSSILESDFLGAMIGQLSDGIDLTEDKTVNKRRRSKDILFNMEQPLNFSGEQERRGSSKGCCLS